MTDIHPNRTSPPLIINTPEDGYLRIGRRTEEKVDRADQVKLAAGSGASLRIFKDGGWELRGVDQKNAAGSSLMNKGESPLTIYSEGDVNITATNNIKMKTVTGNITLDAAEDVIINSRKDTRIDADRNVKIISTNYALDAAQNIFSRARGWHLIVGNPVYVYEKKTKLIPTSINDVVDSLIEQFALGA